MSAVASRELRALDVLEVVPAHHGAILVRNTHSLPHLKPGELAVFDTRDREPCHGEVFAIRYSNGLSVMQVVVGADANGDEYIMCAPLNRPRSREAFKAAIAAHRPIVSSDGPYTRGKLRSKLLGRVVGVMVPR